MSFSIYSTLIVFLLYYHDSLNIFNYTPLYTSLYSYVFLNIFNSHCILIVFSCLSRYIQLSFNYTVSLYASLYSHVLLDIINYTTSLYSHCIFVSLSIYSTYCVNVSLTSRNMKRLILRFHVLSRLCSAAIVESGDGISQLRL